MSDYEIHVVGNSDESDLPEYQRTALTYQKMIFVPAIVHDQDLVGLAALNDSASMCFHEGDAFFEIDWFERTFPECFEYCQIVRQRIDRGHLDA